MVTSLKTMERSEARGSAVIPWILVTIVVFGSLLAAIWLRPTDQNKIPGYTPLIERNLLGPFELSHHDGRLINSDFFAGDWTLVFFGFTHCPDVCLTTLSVLNQLVIGMGENAPRVVFVGVDPERDRALIKGYVHAFNPDFHGVTGGLTELQNLGYQLQTLFALDNDMVTHTSNIMLVNPDAEFVGYFRVPHRPDTMARALGELM